MRILFAAALLILAALSSAIAREQTDAPDAVILGFSPDGRYFAFEEFAYDIVSDALFSAIHVLDRTTGNEAEGFPLGLVPEQIGDEFPAPVGGFEADVEKVVDAEGEPDLDALRSLVRKAAGPKLDALKIGVQGRRVAGVPLTQRAPADSNKTPLEFVLWPTIPGGIPDQQYVYRLQPAVAPDKDDCYSAEKPVRSINLAFKVAASQTYPELKQMAETTTDYALPLPAGSCQTGIWLSDIIVPPRLDAEAPMVVVFLLSTVWQSHTDDARWRALFLPLPQPK